MNTAAMTAPTPRLQSQSRDVEQQRYLDRWLKVWVALLSVVTFVVVLYLINITDSLANINGNLGVARNAVTGAGGHVLTLPDQIQGINGSLSQIAPALTPIPGQADQIISALTSVNANLTTTDSSLKDTSGSLVNTSSSLVNTSGSLVNTSSVLSAVLGLANNINGVLHAADLPAGKCGIGNTCQPNQLGVTNIYERVAVANSILNPAQVDATNIIGGLNSVDRHLTSICHAAAVNLLHGVEPC